MPTPKCVRGCKDDEFWGDSKHYAANVYTVGPDVEEIQKELYTNGPVEVAFTVYQVSRSTCPGWNDKLLEALCRE
jgi:cathepsin B